MYKEMQRKYTKQSHFADWKNKYASLSDSAVANDILNYLTTYMVVPMSVRDRLYMYVV